MQKSNLQRFRLGKVGAVLVAFTLLAACSPLSAAPAPTSIPTVDFLQEEKAAGPIARTYHGVLMLERSADLILAGIEKIQAGQILPTDISAISLYTEAFPLAVDYLSQATPPGEFEDPWQQINIVAQQYNLARSRILAGTEIPSQVLDLLKDSRKVLNIDQGMFEKYLANGGAGADFLSAEQKAVDEHIKQSYGERSVPIISP